MKKVLNTPEAQARVPAEVTSHDMCNIPLLISLLLRVNYGVFNEFTELCEYTISNPQPGLVF